MRLLFISVLIAGSFLLVSGEAVGLCLDFLGGVEKGVVEESSLKEISGITASRKNPGVLWVHNDSGDSARVFAMNDAGGHLGIYNLSGAGADDYEDIAIGPGPDANKDYLYIADMGNNDGLTNQTFSIYRVAEPNISPSQSPVEVSLGEVEQLLVKYPDGLRHDSETLLVDPVNGDIYVCTRDRWDDDNGTMKVYRFAAPQVAGDVNVMDHVADVQLVSGQMAVGGDISRAGRLIIIRTRGTAESVLIWQRDLQGQLWDAFTNPMCEVPSITEPQGEAVCFDSSGCGYFTVSEFKGGVHKKGIPLYYFARDGNCGARAGDFELDGGVDFKDFNELGWAWQSSVGDWNWSQQCDISEPNDERIDEFDLEVFVGNWGMEILN